MDQLKSLLHLVQDSFAHWSDHKAPRLGASLAYYTLLSIAPLILVVVAICGVVFSQQQVQHEIIQQANELVGPKGASSIQAMLRHSKHPGDGIFAGFISLITLLFGASGVCAELRDALNTIWDAPPLKSSGLVGIVKQRLVSFAMVLSMGFLLLTSLILSATLAVVERFFNKLIPIHPAILEVTNILFSTVAIAVLFALIFKFVPDVPVNWRDVLVGSVVTSVLFMAGKSLLALYLATAGVGSTYGAAGSVIAFVVWVYYSAQIFLFGATFTRIYANIFGVGTGHSLFGSQRTQPVVTPG